jgi:hypothetical protein
MTAWGGGKSLSSSTGFGSLLSHYRAESGNVTLTCWREDPMPPGGGAAA